MLAAGAFVKDCVPRDIYQQQYRSLHSAKNDIRLLCHGQVYFLVGNYTAQPSIMKTTEETNDRNCNAVN